MMEKIKDSELVLAPDGSLYHLRLTGDTLADNVILVGDPQRVNLFRPHFDRVDHEVQNRELHSLTGSYKGRRFTVLSTGMGTDNIDIVMTELDACANMDLSSRTPRTTHRSLNIVRLGTSGSLQGDVPCGSLVASEYAIGLDGLLNYYQHDDSTLATGLRQAFVAHAQLPTTMAQPYAVACDRALLHHVGQGMHHGITVTAPGFYAPQGRQVRLVPTVSDLTQRLSTFNYEGHRVVNLEMECSAIFGLAQLMGHRALTVCLIIANRVDGSFLNDYHEPMQQAITLVMDRMATC